MKQKERNDLETISDADLDAACGGHHHRSCHLNVVYVGRGPQVVAGATVPAIAGSVPGVAPAVAPAVTPAVAPAPAAPIPGTPGMRLGTSI